MAPKPLPKTLNDLCRPAALYFVLNIIAIIVIAYQNFGNTNKLCIGEYSCDVPSTMLVFSIELVYVLFFTWVLNLICKEGYSTISWVIALLPFILFFVILALFMIGH
tara:strand:+ start:1610 stop:1930 length:321 start_codon:yes stop_codon:yes gene_type:complete